MFAVVLGWIALLQFFVLSRKRPICSARPSTKPMYHASNENRSPAKTAEPAAKGSEHGSSVGHERPRSSEPYAALRPPGRSF